MSADGTKVVCNCGWRGFISQVLHAPNPFDSGDTLDGCPKCGSVNTIWNACDEPGCWSESTCGTPTPAGYRMTCSKHRPKEEMPK